MTTLRQRALGSPRWEDRSRALQSLSDAYGDEAIPTLVAALEDSEQAVRSRAIEQLVASGDEAAARALMRRLEVEGGRGDLIVAANAVEDNPASVHLPLVELLLRDRRMLVRGAAIEAAAELAAPLSVDLLRRCARDPNLLLRRRARRLLGRRGLRGT
jgi:HEAT repeat protein